MDIVLRRYHDNRAGDLASQETATRVFDHLVQFYKGVAVSGLTIATHKDYEIDRRKNGWSNSTINRTRNTLRAALNDAVKDWLLR